jgi:indolepyruvate ferredoxin oxidoreductase
VADYETVLDELTRDLAPDNLDLAVQIAQVPEQIRGFDTVKDFELATAKEKEAELLDAFRRRVRASDGFDREGDEAVRLADRQSIH